jgi:hypothetical protein
LHRLASGYGYSLRGLLLVLICFACGCIDLEVARFARVRAGSSTGNLEHAVATGAGRSCVTVVGIVPFDYPPSLGDAVASASAGGPLTDVVVRYELRYVPLLFGRGCYVVEGRTP